MDINSKLVEKGIVLPVAPPPAANYIPYVKVDKLVFISGQVSQNESGFIKGFLGEDLNYYTFWSTTEEVDLFAEQVNDFFSRQIIFPKIQTGGSDIKIKLTSSQISKIEKIYKKDFKLIQK